MDSPEPRPPLRLQWLDPAELPEHPDNWRLHPDAQLRTLADVIGQVGWAGALLFNERTGRLIDGHARKKLDPALLVDGKVPVLVGAWDEEQEKLILATLDPLAAMAESNETALRSLLGGLESQSEAVQALLDQLASTLPADDGDDTAAGLDASSYEYEEQFGVIVVCRDAAHQEEVFEELKARGYECKVVVV